MSASQRKLDRPVQEVIDFAISFTSLSSLPQGKFRLRSGVSDLMHTMGYYVAQARKREETMSDRINNVAEALKHISDNLDS